MPKKCTVRIKDKRIVIKDDYNQMLIRIIDYYNLENPSQAVKFLIKKTYTEIKTN